MNVVTSWSATGSTIEEIVPHADLIQAVLDGKVVQWSPHIDTEWTDMSPTEALNDLVTDPGGSRYRIKPEPVVLWGVVDAGGVAGFGEREAAARTAKHTVPGRPLKVLRLELDPESLDVISATTEAP